MDYFMAEIKSEGVNEYVYNFYDRGLTCQKYVQ